MSEDGTIRIWSAASHQQIYEFDAVGEGVTCAAYHPSGCDLACGFDSGTVRVFDITSAALVQEIQQHKGPVAQVSPGTSHAHTRHCCTVRMLKQCCDATGIVSRGNA